MNIYDIAAEAGVSIATVSRVLNKKGTVSPATRANKRKGWLGFASVFYAFVISTYVAKPDARKSDARAGLSMMCYKIRKAHHQIKMSEYDCMGVSNTKSS